VTVPTHQPVAFDPARSSAEEFDRQVDHLVASDYPALLGLDEAAFRDGLAPLAAVAATQLITRGAHQERTAAPSADSNDGDWVPFVLVIAGALPLDEAANRMTLNGRAARLMLTPEEIPGYRALPSVSLPDATAYLLMDIDAGSEFCNVTPESALVTITSRGRSPLTIAEGIALVTHRPDKLRKNKCFSLSASRRGDQRVPAIWISERAPKLGWCWDRNPHTWLGSASAGGRVAA
jgi:Family of unknown function (DUF5701)